MRNNDYYQVLGLKPTCTPHEIKKSYRQLALIWHPDKHNNKKEAQVQFTSINEAYNILIDTNKRRIYDNYGHEGLSSTQEGTKSQNKFFEKGFCGADKSAFDVLKDIFQENDDDDFFKNFDLSGMCGNMKANVQSFVYKHVISSDDEENDFFTDYTPTFMNTTFTSSLSSLNNQFYGGEGSSTEFFSSFFADSFENESDNKNKNPAKKKQKKNKKTTIEEENAYETLNKDKTSKHACPSNTRKAGASKSRKNSKDSFLINSGNGIFEEEFHIEFNLVGQKRRLNFSIDILEGTDNEVFTKKSCPKNSSGKTGGKKRSNHEGRKKVKK